MKRKRLYTALKMDILIQWRIKLYLIGVLAGAIVAAAVSQITAADQLYLVIPTLMLLVIGGSTLLYVAALIVFERDEGTINAIMVSPIRIGEYLGSKIISLTLLITVESFVMIGGSMLLIGISDSVVSVLPNIPVLWLGIAGNAVIYTLIGIILIVRYRRVTEFFIPLAAVAVIAEIPMIYFLGVLEHPALLIIPTSAPTVIIKGAFVELDSFLWTYAVLYTVTLIAGLGFWAYRSFKKHVVMNIT